ncbi:MAG: hypothetical protein IT183_07410 [Acidobacteria bacterium]|nr:hypothetical protein [Acidobacteriota bacterium]
MDGIHIDAKGSQPVIDQQLQIWLFGWAVVAAYLLVRHWRTGRAVGLVFTYVFSFGAIHWLAATLHALPWYAAPTTDETIIGLRVATIGLIAFAVGGELGVLLSRRFGLQMPESDDGRLASPRIVTLYIVGGVVVYVGIAPIVAGLPTASALVSTASSLMVLGVALKAWNGWQNGRPMISWFWMAASAVFPLMTLVGQGFLGFGFAAMLIVAAFVASFYRPRWQVVVAALLVAYLGMSVYVTYMRDRREIRAVVWGGESITARFDTLAETFTNFEWFDLTRPEHVWRVDDRLNQNWLLGAAVDGIESGAVPRAMGGTLVDAAIALVPRAIWPGKPVMAGSGNLVSDYTGLTFAEGTSVGVGHVMEWYINFALPGVIIGFFVIGSVLVFVDRSAAAWLHHGDVGRFSLWFLPGTSMLNVGGSFVEMTATAAACWVIAWVLQRSTARWEEDPLSGHKDAVIEVRQ